MVSDLFGDFSLAVFHAGVDGIFDIVNRFGHVGVDDEGDGGCTDLGLSVGGLHEFLLVVLGFNGDDAPRLDVPRGWSESGKIDELADGFI